MLTMKFQIFVLVVTLCGTLSNSVSDDEESVKDTIVALFDSVFNVTDVVLYDGIDALLKYVEENEPAFTQAAVNNIKQPCKLLVALIRDAVDQMKDELSTDANKVVDCVDAEFDKIMTAFDDVFTNVTTCALPETEIIVMEMRKVFDQISSLHEEVKAEVNNLDECILGDILCLVSFASGLAQTIGKAGDDLKEEVYIVIELIQKVYEDMSACPVSDAISERAQEIFNDSVTCIVDSRSVF